MDSTNALINYKSNNIIPIGEQLTGNLKQLSDAIDNGQDDLKVILHHLNESSIEVTIEKNWIGLVKKSSLEEIIEKVYKNLSSYIVQCGKALQNTNDNLSRSLDLIKLLALVEKDLYKILDDQIVSNNELKDILSDWFKKQGINDNDVRELLESSFQRAYTLRDRLNNFRQEYKSNIANCEKRILDFENKHNSLDTEIAKLIKDSSNKLHVLVNEYEAETKRLYKEFAQSRDDAITDVCYQTEQASIQIQSAKNEIEKNVKCSKDNLKDLVDSFMVDLEKLKKQQSEIFEEDRKKLFVKLKRAMTWTVIASISLSTVLSYFISHLL